uniref:Coiled-coil domain containing 191 n=1 Tax=Astyanax mexicanus TaxID=7994 RepID=A0A8B9GTW2_ASTMX
MKRVEMASEFAVSEVFSPQKVHTAKLSQAVALQSMEQLQDHDDAYSEAQAILSDWMNSKLRLELEVDEDQEELTDSSNKESPEKTATLSYNNFEDMYSRLAQEDESFEVNNFLQDLMEREVLDSGEVEGLRLDTEVERKRRDPGLTMQLRHQQVKERRLRRDAEREKHHKEQEVKKEAREEAQRLEREEQRRRKLEARKQEELIQQEMIRLRRHLEDKRNMEQLARKMERERLETQRASERSGMLKSASVTEKQLQCREQEMEAKAHILNLQVSKFVLEKRVRLGKAAALCDWRRQLRAWRAWRALVWVKREEREAERTEEELRMENRRCQVAEESDRRRLLRRSLNDWRLWCRMEKERKDLLKQKEETRRKMVALITAATSGKLSSENCTDSPVTAIPDVPIKPENHIQPVTPAPSTLTDRKASPPTQAWQVTRRHAALSPAELRQAHQRQPPNNAPRCQSAERGGRFEHRHLAQQQTIAEQRRLLKEQQELILHLQERQNFLDFRQEKVLLISCIVGVIAVETLRYTGEGFSQTRITLTNNKHLPRPPQAQMKAAEEERLRQEEEEKRMAAERRKEERRQQKERELEKQKRIERKQKLLKQAQEHYQRSLLLHRGLAPWKRLLEKSRTNSQKAKDHHSHVLQRQCLLSWLQTAGDALAEKVACANQLYTNILLRRAFCNWKRCILEAQADRFFRAQALRKGFTALLDHATHQRLLSWTKEQQAEEHNDRRLVRRCLSGWIRLPAALREERVREERRERLRRKVAEILPDFRSSPVDGLWSPAPSH